jgi:type I restriction enzyme M protein
MKITNNNKLRDGHINKIVDTYVKRELAEHFSVEVENSEISEQDYNLSVSTYVEPEDTREIIDIVKLNAEIKEIVTKVDFLRDEIDSIIKEIEGDNHE